MTKLEVEMEIRDNHDTQYFVPFMTDLVEVLRKHNASISIGDDYSKGNLVLHINVNGIIYLRTSVDKLVVPRTSQESQEMMNATMKHRPTQ